MHISLRREEPARHGGCISDDVTRRLKVDLHGPKCGNLVADT